MGVSALVAAATLAVSPQQFLLAHQAPGGGFAETGGKPDATLTAWALLGLRAAGAPADDTYMRAHEADLQTPTELALGVLAETRPAVELVARLERALTPGLNATAWKLIALAQAGRAIPRDRKERRLGLGRWRRAGLERHGRRRRGAAGRARRRPTDPPRARISAAASERGRRLRACEGSRLRRAVHGLGDPGVPGRGSAPRTACLPVPRPAAPRRRELPLQRALCDDAGVGDRAGPPGARPPAVPAGLGCCSALRRHPMTD